jgi:phthiocerol/phenolphthiocerol synthesis type-I polyketide synthase D
MGALRLHGATRGHDLDWWVGFSSVASLLGSPGQAAYAAANAWLDALVAWRRAAGLPATAINWGQWSEVGVARGLRLEALDPIAPTEGIEALEALLDRDVAQAGVARLRLDRAAAVLPEIGELGFFAGLVAELDPSEGSEWVGVEALSQMELADAGAAVLARLRTRISAIMGYADDTAILADQPLTGLGLDSLMAVRIRNAVRADFGVEPPVALLLQGATPKDVAADLMRQLGIAAVTEPSRPADGLRDRTQQRVAARRRAALRRRAG